MNKKQYVKLVKLLRTKAVAESVPTTFKGYQAWARMGWHIGNHRKIKRFTKRCDYIMAVGLGGETGEVLEVLKKSVRDKQSPDFKQNLILELGDVLYYMAIIASRHGITFEDIVKGNYTKLTERRRKKLAKLKKSNSFAENRVNEDLKGYKKAFKIRDKYLNRR